MTDGGLADILAAAARAMRAEFNSSQAIRHNASKGSTREQLLIRFLKKYLPKTVECTGPCEIASVDGQRSGQIDIAIYDPAVAPLYQERGFCILPAECVYAVIEVKSKLNRSELRNSIDGVRRVKKLPKTAYLEEESPRTKQVYGQSFIGHLPTAGYVFAYDSVKLDPLYEWFRKEVLKQPCEEAIDAVWVLGRGAYHWADRHSRLIQAYAQPDGSFAVGHIDPEYDVLMNMTLILNLLLADCYMPPLDLRQYFGQVAVLRNVTFKTPAAWRGQSKQVGPAAEQQTST